MGVATSKSAKRSEELGLMMFLLLTSRSFAPFKFIVAAATREVRVIAIERSSIECFKKREVEL